MESIKELKDQIELIDYLCSEERIMMTQTNNYITSQNESEDTREPEHWYPFCYF